MKNYCNHCQVSMDGRALRIVAFVNLYPPTTNAGAELMLHEVLLELKKRGHDVVVAQPTPKLKDLDGIKIISYLQAKRLSYVPDIVFTQNHDTTRAIAYAASLKRPLVHFVHNDKVVKAFRLTSANSSLIVANSEWVAASIKINGLEKMVINPPTDIDKYRVDISKADMITFINLIDIKGGDIFWQITKLLPDRKFLAVKGGYGTQMIRQSPNVEIIENTTDMKEVYSRTRLLLVPSKYESWGRVGIEAMASGIPVIASRTPGLLESIGDAGIFLSPGDVSGFAKWIKMFDDEQLYSKYSDKAIARAEEISSRLVFQVDELESRIRSIVGKALCTHGETQTSKP